MLLTKSILAVVLFGTLATAVDLPRIESGEVVYPVGISKDESIKALILALDAAQLRIAVMEQQLVSVPYQQATLAKARESCKNAGIDFAECVVDGQTGTVKKREMPTPTPPVSVPAPIAK